MKYLDKATFQKISETKATLLKFASVVTTLSTENDFGVGALLLIATRMRESFAKAMERNCDQRYYASVMIVNESKKILKKKFTIFNHPLRKEKLDEKNDTLASHQQTRVNI